MGLLSTVTRVFGRKVVIHPDDLPDGNGPAATAVRALIKELRAAIPGGARSSSNDEYLELVLPRDQLEDCTELVATAYGSPVKPFDTRCSVHSSLRETVDSQGGIWKEQCLYLCRYEDERIGFAAFWPWVGPEKLTLKVGIYRATV